METKELVGKWIESEVLMDTRDVPADTAYRVVGYNADMNAAIVDAGPRGWKGLDSDDIVIEKCETYWYILPVDITKVL
jgi:hypothetical protein